MELSMIYTLMLCICALNRVTIGQIMQMNREMYIGELDKNLFGSFDSLTAPSAIVCCATCSWNERCKTVNYHETTGECQLLPSPATVAELPTDSPGWTWYHPEEVTYPRDCTDVQAKINVTVVNVYPYPGNHSHTKEVLCDMTTDRGGWTVIMNRMNGKEEFNLLKKHYYIPGFGDPRGEFWMGLEMVHTLTSDGRQYELRIDLTANNGSQFFEVYDNFKIGPGYEHELFVGKYSGTAGDSLSRSNGSVFTNMVPTSNAPCINFISEGRWWFNNCTIFSCLTCPYKPGQEDCQAMTWYTVDKCIGLSTAKMMFRPTTN